ncbi:MAG TPA: hypothetical protein VFL54_10495 [Gammaproteobacteria bacterium]|nr:hypothetical protein [Gammaproteobacteria bacterium]
MKTIAEEETVLAALNRLFVKSLLALGAGPGAERDHACRLAAAGWSALRHTHPREAERLNGLLHSLTRSTHPATADKGD